MIGVGQCRGLEENASVIVTSVPLEFLQFDGRTRGKVTGEGDFQVQGLEIGHLKVKNTQIVLTQLDAATSSSPQVQSNFGSSGASWQPPTQISWPASNSKRVPCESILIENGLKYHLLNMNAAPNFTSTIGITLGQRQPDGKSDNVDH